MKIEAQVDISILTPTRKIVEQKKVSEIAFPAAMGEIDILAGHLPFLGFLGIGDLHYKLDEISNHIAIRNGFVELHNDHLTILAEEAMLPGEILTLEIEEELKHIDSRLSHDVLEEATFRELAEKHRWLTTQLTVAAMVTR